MSDHQDRIDAHIENLVQERADAAREWDEGPDSLPHPRNLIGAAEAQLLGAAGKTVVGNRDGDSVPDQYFVGNRGADSVPASFHLGDGAEVDELVGAPGDIDDLVGHPGDLDDLVGDVLEEMVLQPDATGGPGPIEFEGKEDYIRGDAGTTACLRGCTIVGSVPQAASKMGARMNTRPAVTQGRAQFIKAVSPIKGRIHTAMVVPRSSKHPSDAVSIANARQAVKYATQVASKLDHVIVSAAKKPARPVVVARPMAIVGFMPRPNGSGTVRLSLAQIKKMSNDLRAQAQKTAAAADKHATVVSTNKAKIAAGVKAAAAMLKPRTTGIHGDDGVIGVGSPFDDVVQDARPSYDILGEQAAILGDMLRSIVLGASPDPANPGYLDNGWLDPDPKYGALPPGYNPDGSPMAGTAPTDGSVAPSGRYPGPDSNYGLPAAPTVADAEKAYMDPMNFMSEPAGGDQLQYSASTPDELKAKYLGAIPFTFDLGSAHVPPFKAICSRHTFLRQLYDQNQPDPGDGGHDTDGVGSGFEWHGTDGSRWFVYWVAGSGSHVNPPSAEEANNLDVMFDHSGAHQWGPLIGNPNMKEWAGLRYAYGSGSAGAPMFFWFRDQAPDWAKSNDILVLYNQMLTDYATQLTTAKANYLAQVAQDVADAQQAQAISKQQTQENASAAHQADLAASADAVAQQQLATQQQQQDVAWQGQQDQFQSQQQQLAFQQGQAETAAYADWLKQGGGQANDGGEPDDGGGQTAEPFDDLNQQDEGQPFDGDAPMDASEAEINAKGSARLDSGDLEE